MDEQVSEVIVSPISYLVNVHRLAKSGMRVKIRADDEMREGLAKAHDLVRVETFEAHLHVLPWKRDGIRVVGQIKTKFEQACVLTLEPIKQNMDTPFEATLLPENSTLAKRHEDPSQELFIDAMGDDSPDLFSGDTIDIGSLTEQYFSLELDPYPKKEGANFYASTKDEKDEEEEPSPFAKLAKLQTKD